MILQADTQQQSEKGLLLRSFLTSEDYREITLEFGAVSVSVRTGYDDWHRFSVEVECHTDFDGERPPCWETLKTLLKKMDFELETDWDDDSEECFVPSSFFSADAVILGTRTYGRTASCSAFDDVLRLIVNLQPNQFVRQS